GGSIYFGCREPHLPLEYGYAKALLARGGHIAEIFDAQAEALDDYVLAARVANFSPDMTVVTTAPSYLFWRCAPPELRVPQQTLKALKTAAGISVLIGPHVSTTPRAALQKVNADVGIIGEPEEILLQLVGTPPARWSDIASICYRLKGDIIVQGGPHQSDMAELPVLVWSRDTIQQHQHHHHRFDTRPEAPGAEMEVSRGCPYHCTFCAKE